MPDVAINGAFSKREAGRPRLYSDEAIFAAVDLVLRRDGLADLTLEAVADEVGCTRQALVRRYGLKRGLLLAYLDALVTRLSLQYASDRDETKSTLEDLHDWLTLPWADHFRRGMNPRLQASILTFILTFSYDPEFSARFTAIHQTAMDGIELLLVSAVEEGALRPVDTTMLTRMLYAMWTGETINWCISPTIDVTDRLDQAFHLILDPHLTTEVWTTAAPSETAQ